MLNSTLRPSLSLRPQAGFFSFFHPAPSIPAPSPRVVAATLDRIAYTALWAFVFAVPWEDTVPLLGGFPISRWLGMAAFGITLLRLGVLQEGRRLREIHYWLLAFAAWSCASVFWSVDWDSSAFRAGTYAQLLILAWLIWELVFTEERVMGLLGAYLLGTYVCAIGTISNLLAGKTSGQLDDVDTAVKSGRYTIEGLNPNDLGLMLALSLPMTMYLLLRKRRSPAVVIVCWIQFGLALLTVVLTGSRGALLATCAAMLMFPAVMRQLPRAQKIAAGAICGGAAALGAYLVPPDTWLRFSNLGRDLTEGTMTHRTQIWVASLQTFREHPFFGVGSGAHPAAVVKLIARPLVAHNTFISVLVELGVTGELILLGLLGAALYCALRMRGLERLLWLATLAAWCVGVCGGTWEYRKTTWFIFSLLAAHVFARRYQNRTGKLYDI